MAENNTEWLIPNISSSAPLITIYTNSSSPRLEYVCNFIFHKVLRCRYALTSQISDYQNAECAINYSATHLESGLQVIPSGMLFETSYRTCVPKPDQLRAQTVIFKQPEEIKEYQFGFDVFSAVFYFISRYEEWQEGKRDEHERFEAEHSWLCANGLLQRPLVDEWICLLKTALEKKTQLVFPEKKFQFISTIDVDNLYAFKAKSVIRSLGGGFKDLLRGKTSLVSDRIKVLFSSQKDPFDVYDTICKTAGAYKHTLLFFFLYSNNTRFDRTVKPGSSAYKKVVATLSEYGIEAGLHPSYASYNDKRLLANEIQSWQIITQKPVSLSRQHYLRFDITTTPLLLQQQGILADFTMGFASKAGFRAATSHPFQYYNFHKEQAEKLIFVPFAIMDGSYFVYKNLSPEHFLKDALELAEIVKKTGGIFVTVTHERSFSDTIYKGFNTTYQKLAKALQTY